MLKAFDIVLGSSDLSLDRVLGAGLPVALVFYDHEISFDLRKIMDDLAGQYAGRALIVTLSRNDAPQAISRFGVKSLPSLVTIRDGKTVASLPSVRQADLKPYLAHLLGEGPLPTLRPTARANKTSGQTAAAAPVA